MVNLEGYTAGSLLGRRMQSGCAPKEAAKEVNVRHILGNTYPGGMAGKARQAGKYLLTVFKRSVLLPDLSD